MSVHTARPKRQSRRSLQAVALLLALVAMATVLAVRPTAAEAKKYSYPRVWSPNMKRHVYEFKAKYLSPQLATWYGPEFFGNRTACGNVLKSTTWGIAHRTLPCGKLVRVKFRGRKIAVPVIDRGPYSGATVDLTDRTARFLRFKRYGRGHLKVAVLRRTIPTSTF